MGGHGGLDSFREKIRIPPTGRFGSASLRDASCCAMENALQPTASAMSESFYQGRRAVTIENQLLRVTVLIGGGHIAEVYEKSADINPLWTPPCKSIEPAEFDRLRPTG